MLRLLHKQVLVGCRELNLIIHACMELPPQKSATELQSEAGEQEGEGDRSDRETLSHRTSRRVI
jgi:hypothetical protein